MCDEVRLLRYDGGETPWGFRLTGGRDFGTPLLVVKVIGGSVAALAGVNVGDIVWGINYVPTSNFTHLDAQRAILESGDTLILNLIRGGDVAPVIEVQSPEDKEVEEIAQYQVSDDLDMAFVVKLNRSGRISAVEEIPTPSTTPSTTPNPNADKKRKTSGTGSGSGSASQSAGASRSASRRSSSRAEPDEDKKRKISVTFKDDGPISIEPPSYEEFTKTEQKKQRDQNGESMKEVTLTEEMKMETTLKKTTTQVTERSEEFINEVRDQITSQAKKENRELTEEEIMEMMAGEAEVIDEQKGTIGVNFQKFMPKCEFIKDSSVFKVLQEEQTKKERTEKELLAKDPNKRFSKFLIKPDMPKPLPKPKPVHPEPMAWQKKLSDEKTPPEQNGVVAEQTAVTEEKKSEVQVAETGESHIVENSQQHMSMQVEEIQSLTTSSFSSSSAFTSTKSSSSTLTRSDTDETDAKDASDEAKRNADDDEGEIAKTDLSPVEGEDKETDDLEGGDEDDFIEGSKLDEEFERLCSEDEAAEDAEDKADEDADEPHARVEKETEEVAEKIEEAEIEEVSAEQTEKENEEKTESKKDLPHGQEDVEICESKVKPALPLTPQLRPLVLPGGRKWYQPKDAFNEEFIAETIVAQSEVLVGTTIGVNFRKYIPPKFDTANSAVCKLIHEIEEKSNKGIKGVAERPEKVHGLDDFYQPPISKRHFYAATLAADKTHVDNLAQPQKTTP